MNREIKFRAWIYKQRRMIKVVGFDFAVPNPTVQWYDDMADALNGKVSDTFMDNTEIMQYTGLKDKNGVEIYEGDIVRYKQSIQTTIGTVKFGEYEQDGSGGEYRSPTCLGFYIQRVYIVPEKWDKEIGGPYYRSEDDRVSPYEVNDIEVIGNKFEHPHLLKEGETVEKP